MVYAGERGRTALAVAAVLAAAAALWCTLAPIWQGATPARLAAVGYASDLDEVPAVPGVLRVTPGKDQAELTLLPPPSPVTGYEISVRGAGWRPFPTGGGTLTGLRNGQKYAVKLRAVNASGPGRPADVTIDLPAMTPDPPTAVTAAPGDGTATLTFQAADDNGSPVTGYEVSVDGRRWTAVTAARRDGHYRTLVSDLRAGTAQTVRLRARNAIGAGEPAGGVVVRPAASGSAVTQSVPAAPSSPAAHGSPAAQGSPATQAAQAAQAAQGSEAAQGSAAAQAAQVVPGKRQALAGSAAAVAGSPAPQTAATPPVATRRSQAAAATTTSAAATTPAPTVEADGVDQGQNVTASMTLPVTGRGGLVPFGAFLLIAGTVLLVVTGRRYLILPEANPIV